jgi:cystathionine beta-lyase
MLHAPQHLTTNHQPPITNHQPPTTNHQPPMYNFDELINRRGTNSIKWEAGELLRKFGITQRFDRDSIPLFVADMDFACPQPVIEALRRRVDQRIFGYTWHGTSPGYIEAIQNWFRRRQDWEIRAEDIVYSPGTVHALDVAVKAITKPGDGVIIQRPVYAPFTRVVEDNARVVKNNELVNNDGYYTVDFEDLERIAGDHSTTLMILCSPHNPVGRIWNPDELKRMAEICRNNNVILVSDEIHGDLIRKDQTFYPIANLAGTENMIICTAINKTFNLAGLHCSNIVITNPELRERYVKHMGMQFPSPFTISALIAAYNESEDWLEELKGYIDGNFDFLEQFLAKHMPQVRFRKPEGTYIAWLDFSDYSLDPEEIHDRIYMKANVVLEDGRMFGEGSEQFQRICLPTPRALLMEAMERIAGEF